MKKIYLLLTAVIALQMQLCAQGKVITVSTTDAFLKAIQPNVTIKITKDLDFTKDLANYIGKGEYYEIDTSYNIWNRNNKQPEEYGVIIKDVDNITITGTAQVPVKLTCDFKERSVLCFINCKTVKINNITAGHRVAAGCSGSVFTFETCVGVEINKSNLFGSGAEGIFSVKSKDIKFQNGTIYECSQNIAYFSQSSGIKFLNSKFYNNKDNWSHFVLDDTQNVDFQNCSISDNTIYEYMEQGNGYLFNLDKKSGNVSLTNCVIKNNIVNHIVAGKDLLKITNATFTGNTYKFEEYFAK